jgi:hypothetical protein
MCINLPGLRIWAARDRTDGKRKIQTTHGTHHSLLTAVRCTTIIFIYELLFVCFRLCFDFFWISSSPSPLCRRSLIWLNSFSLRLSCQWIFSSLPSLLSSAVIFSLAQADLFFELWSTLCVESSCLLAWWFFLMIAKYLISVTGVFVVWRLCASSHQPRQVARTYAAFLSPTVCHPLLLKCWTCWVLDWSLIWLNSFA